MGSSSRAREVSDLSEVYELYRKHFGAPRDSTRLALLEAIREAYPDYHVTCIDKDEVDFKGFADSGKATIAYVTGGAGDEDLFEAIVEYKPPRRRLEQSAGQLVDDVKFGKCIFKHGNEEFIIYKACWSEGAWCSTVGVWYVLAPRAGAEIKDGHHPSTQAMLLDVARWTSITHDEIYVFDDSCWTKSAELWRSVEGASWDDVIMDPKMKQSLIDDVQGFFDNQELYARFGVPWKRGIILHGVPGNGKTISIKALMNHLSSLPEAIPSLFVKSLDNKCDMPQYSVNKIFRKARKMAPCLLVFEDLDSLIVDKVRSYFLNEVDGLESNDGILMIGSTNHLNRLDPAISKRPSRFDRKYHFRVPDRAQRIAYAEYWRKKVAGKADIDFPEELCPVIGDLTQDFSFAYLKELFVMSLLTVARGGKGIEEPTDNGWDVVSETVSPAEPADGAETDKEGKEKAAGEKEKEKQKKKPKEVPVIEVPEHLKENVFLRVIQSQAKNLLLEMDNTDEEDQKKTFPVLSDNRPGMVMEALCDDGF